MSKKKILCVGGAGFLGSHLSHRFAKSEKYSVAQADIWSAKLKLKFQNEPFEFHNVDISKDAQTLDEMIEDYDIVLNLASVPEPRMYVQQPLQVARLNLFDGYKIIEACARRKKTLIHFSTSEVYGKTLGSEEPFEEDSTNCITGPIQNHRWIYSTSKQMLDRLIFGHGQQDNLKFTIVRPFNIVGPLQDHVMENSDDGAPRVFAHFMSALINGEPLRLVDGGQTKRTFLHVEDLVDALELILDNPEKTNGQIFNIGHPETETTIADLAALMRDIYETKLGGIQGRSDLITVSSKDFYGEGYEDTERRMPDISKLQELGWSPKFNLRELLEDTMSFTFKYKDRLTQKAMDAME